MVENVYWHKGHINREDRCGLLGKNNKVLWFTGLSGSGKSTLAHLVEKKLFDKGILSYTLDGDNVRHGLNSDLGFSAKDREENIRRIGEVVNLFYNSGIFVLVCFISPYKKDRDKVRKMIGDDFIEIFVDCSVEECEKRDVKGLYKKARKGEIKDFTGVSAPYERPERPEIVVDTKKLTVEEAAKKIIRFLE
jgi:adenylylsulfate kinase